MPSETSAVNAAYIEARMKQFKLVDMREQYQELIRVASEQSMTYEDFLIMLLQAEETGKKRRQAERLTDAANFDSDKRLSDIDYRFNPNGSIDAIATDALFREVDLVIIGLYPQATVDWLLENMPKMKKLQQNRSRTCTANPDEYSLHRLHFPSSTGSAPSDPAHRPSAPFRHYKRRRSRSGQADDTPRLTVFHVSYDRHRDLPPNRRRTEKSQTDRPTRNIGTHEG